MGEINIDGNEMGGGNPPESLLFENPKNFDKFPRVQQYFNILINNKTQLEFLEDCEIGIVDPSHLVTNNKSRLLANLLNNYNIGSWNNNPNSIRTTANFIVDYIGDPELAPLEYRFNINCSYIVVLSLLDNKKYEQYVLMVER